MTAYAKQSDLEIHRDAMIAECRARNNIMTEWERRTIHSIRAARTVWPNMLRELKQIHARVTAPAWDVK